MADIRIKDLTTTASSTASDDFIAVDGTTNGTRKLNAFSPTFGGNATVTGTLTVNGAGGSIGGQWKITNATIPDVWLQNTSGATSAYRNILIRQNSDDTFKFLSTSDAGVLSKDNILTGSNANGAIGIGVTPAAGASSLTVAGVIKTNDTTASTTTSSGALVVGNGTSGGLGVGGAITLGSSLTSTASDGKIVVSGSGNTTGTKELQFVRADGGDSTVLGLAGSAYAGVLTGLGNNDAYLYTSSAYAFRIFVGTANRFDFTATQFKINPSTASTSTSSGALVVSGGVGVAKNASIGVNNSTGVLRICDNSFGSDYVVLTTAGTDATGTYGLFISQASGTGLNAPTGQMASLRVNNAAIVSANSAGPILQLTGTAPTLTGNSSLTFEFTSNTSLTLKMRGSDGVTRSASITFA